MYDAGDYLIGDLSDVFNVSLPTIDRALARQRLAG
jgi:hypothetical protein